MSAIEDILLLDDDLTADKANQGVFYMNNYEPRSYWALLSWAVITRLSGPRRKKLRENRTDK